MQTWTCDQESRRLVRIEPPSLSSKPSSLNQPLEMANEPAPRTLMDRILPDRVSVPSCIQLPNPVGNHFEIRSSQINILPKFGNFSHDEPYSFLTKFEYACATFKLQQLCEDGIKLHLIPFALTP